MSKARGGGPAPAREVSEGLIEFLSGVARFLMWVGVLATVVSVGGLVYTCFVFSGSNPPTSPDEAISNIGIFDKILMGGVLALGVSSTYLFWGESFLAAAQLLLAALLFFSPVLLNMVGLANAQGPNGSQAIEPALAALNRGGIILGVIGLVVLAVDLAIRAKLRSQQGWKLDQMRYGKGVKEEVDRHNVFMGKCWQLPFCRKFVRERCPIYHARRTCWRELTGCMCEEEVIRGAMENKPIPKDALMAATYIPRNMKLTMDQKRERCKSCVIYNEHQKHKYKLAMPVTLLVIAGIYILFHAQLIAVMSVFIGGLDKLVGRVTLHTVSTNLDAPTTFQELLLACIMIIVLAYAMKLLEYLIFKLKV